MMGLLLLLLEVVGVEGGGLLLLLLWRVQRSLGRRVGEGRVVDRPPRLLLVLLMAGRRLGGEAYGAAAARRHSE